MYQKLSVDLSPGQVAKIAAGKTIQLSAAQLKGNKYVLMVHPETVKKAAMSIKKDRGCRITLTPHELDMSGEGLKEVLAKLRQGAKFIKDKVIDSEFYQKNIKPVARDVVTQGVDMLTKRVPMPEVVQQGLRQGVDKLGQVTNAYGVKPKNKGGRPRKIKLELEDNYSNFQGPNTPAMHPLMPALPAIGGSCERCGHQGGSFRLQ